MMVARAQSSSVAVGEIIAAAARRLARAGVETAVLDAQLLLAAAAGTGRAAVAARNVALAPEVLAKFDALVARREMREPLAYLIGRREFYSLDFEVTPAVLIPRPETETLVGAALEFIAAHPNSRVLDLGTGSGAIAVAFAAAAPGARIVATDLSAAALAVARRNAERHGARARVEFRRANLFEPLDSGAPLGRFDLIVSNPPYIEDAAFASLAPEVARFEPRCALAGGPDGLDFYRRVARAAYEHLEPRGAVMLEVGAGQAGRVAALLTDAGMAPAAVINDLAAVARVVVARRA